MQSTKRIKGVPVKLSTGDKIFYAAINIFLIFIFIIIALPMWSTITLSFRPITFMGSNLQGIFLEPWKWSTAAYSALLGNRGFVNAFLNSLNIFVFGVITALFFTVPLAYSLSVKSLPGRKFFNIFILIPYLFSVGLIPGYLVVTRLGLTDTRLSIYLPLAISTYNCLIMRRFFEGIPDELKESARIDGASELRILLSIMLPLSKPIIMTIGLYYGVQFWNDFFHAMLYIMNESLRPLPILLRNILLGSQMNEFVEVQAFANAPIQSIRAASVFLSAIPLILAYPFIQKYFTKGTLLGGVKG